MGGDGGGGAQTERRGCSCVEAQTCTCHCMHVEVRGQPLDGGPCLSLFRTGVPCLLGTFLYTEQAVHGFFLFVCLFILCVHTWVNMEVKEQLVGVGSILPPCRAWGIELRSSGVASQHL